jgi:hypothetical protein
VNFHKFVLDSNSAINTDCLLRWVRVATWRFAIFWIRLILFFTAKTNSCSSAVYMSWRVLFCVKMYIVLYLTVITHTILYTKWSFYCIIFGRYVYVKARRWTVLHAYLHIVIFLCSKFHSNPWRFNRCNDKLFCQNKILVQGP